MQRILFNFLLAMEGVFANKLRAFLTALGIIFGVSAVIAMLAIGTGAKQSILEQMELIGSNNIVIKSAEPAEGEEDSGGGEKEDLPDWSPGLSMQDVQSIEKILPSIHSISPEVILSVNVIQSGKLQKGKCIGVNNNFFALNNLNLGAGTFFHDQHIEAGRPVCIIGRNVQNRFFSQESPVGKRIKCGQTWLTIIGVLEKRESSRESLENLGIRDYNDDVYIPISTALLRFKNRSVITKEDLKQQFDDDDENTNRARPNYHQLDRMVVRVKQSEELVASSSVIARILKRRHKGVVDYEINVPEKELEAQQETQETFNKVLAFIAGISLLVGGIGIMNIMLASVLERTKEIGVRRSLGANRRDIIYQYLFEAIFISLIGGLIGVILGVSAAHFIAVNYDIPTVVSGWSVALSFLVASAVGLIFGIFPARNAAHMDPIKALRTD